MARHAQACGADAIGLNLHPPSSRYVSPAVAAAICEAVEIECIAVVVNRPETDLAELVEAIRPGALQLHGDEPPGFGATLDLPLLKAFRARPGVLEAIQEWGAPRFLLDAWVQGRVGGTGQRVDSSMALEAGALGQMILAGGLHPENVASAIEDLRPWGVDVASGVESAPGVQDPDRIAAFLSASKPG